MNKALQLQIIRDSLKSLAQTAEHLSENLSDLGRPLYPQERQIIAASLLPSLEEQFRMMVGNLVLGENSEAKDNLEAVMSSVIALTDL